MIKKKMEDKWVSLCSTNVQTVMVGVKFECNDTISQFT